MATGRSTRCLTPSLVFLGKELRRAREAAGFSQEQSADDINYVASFVSMVETARRAEESIHRGI